MGYLPCGRGVPSLGDALAPSRASHKTMRRNAMLAVLAAAGFVAGLLLLAPPVFAHRSRAVAPVPHVRYQVEAKIRSSPTSHWVGGAGRRHEHALRAERKVPRGRERRTVMQERPMHSIVHAKGRTRNPAPARFGRREIAPRRMVPPARAPATAAVPPATALSQNEAAAQVPVVSVIRQDAVHPQLEGVEEAATRTAILPDLYDERGRLNRMPALKGSHEILVRQNQMADLDGLTRVSDDDDLAKMRETKVLVPLPVNGGLRVDERLEWNRRYCRPWVAQFLVAIGAAHYGEFHRPLQVNSAVRTVSFQLRLIRRNGNAAQAEGDAASPHLTGQAIDLAKKGLSEAEIAWMRLYLSRLVGAGLIDVEEEFKQACFHVSVYKRYAPPVPQQRLATTHRALTPSLAEAME